MEPTHINSFFNLQRYILLIIDACFFGLLPIVCANIISPNNMKLPSTTLFHSDTKKPQSKSNPYLPYWGGSGPQLWAPTQMATIQTTRVGLAWATILGYYL